MYNSVIVFFLWLNIYWFEIKHAVFLAVINEVIISDTLGYVNKLDDEEI